MGGSLHGGPVGLAAHDDAYEWSFASIRHEARGLSNEAAQYRHPKPQGKCRFNPR
jgi:hypothetical protein